MIQALLDNLQLLGAILLASLTIAAALAPLEAMGWWAGWWLRKDANGRSIPAGQLVTPRSTPTGRAAYYVVFLTGIGGAIEQLNVPMEMRFIERLREKLPTAHVIDTIYPYSVANRGLVHGRFLARFWQFVLNAKLTGRRAVGFLINLRNTLQILVCADYRYGAFFSQGAATVIAEELHKAGYDFAHGHPITIIGYSGGGQIAVGAAPYLAEVVAAPVQVISLGGVLSSTPKIDRIDRVVHVYSNLDRVQRLGLLFPGRWPITFTSAWNRGRRSGRISTCLLPGVRHEGPGGYLDEHSRLPDGRSYLDRTVDVMAGLITAPITPIADDPS